MQIFILDYDIIKNAMYYHDKHVCKIQTEIAQLISNVYRIKYGNAKLLSKIFQKHNINHPLTKWVNASQENFKWTCLMGMALHNEYNYRYPNKGNYKREKFIFKIGLIDIPSFRFQEKTRHFLAIPDKYKQDDVVKAYRNYYINEKLTWINKRTGKIYKHKWTNREKPKWIYV